MRTRLFFLVCTFALAACASETDEANGSSGSASSSATSRGATASVEGRLTFTGSAAPSSLSAKIRVLDVTFADAPSIEVASTSVTLTGPGPHAFTVPMPVVRADVRYAVQAHVDVDGDGNVSKGDFITMESFPVFNGYPSTVDITVKRVD